MENMAFENDGGVQVFADGDTNGSTETEGPAKPVMAQMVATGGLIALQGLIPIFYTGVHSLSRNEKQKAYYKECGLKPEKMSYKAVLMIPLIASFGLFAYYQMLTQEIISQQSLDLILILCLDLLAYLSLVRLGQKLGNGIPLSNFDLVYFIILDVFFCDVIGMSHTFTKMSIQDFRSLCILPGWIPVAFALIFIHLNNVITGLILSAGMFMYATFFTIFGSNVINTVAKSITLTTMAPILTYPHNLFETQLPVDYLPAIGSLDIILPGLFIALMFRFDNHLKTAFQKYFYSSLFAYIFGYFAASYVKINFGYAPPALIFLFPVCVGVPMIVACVCGEFKALIEYEDYPSADPQKNLNKVDDESSRKNGKKIK